MLLMIMIVTMVVSTSGSFPSITYRISGLLFCIYRALKLQLDCMYMHRMNVYVYMHICAYVYSICTYVCSL